MAPPRTHTILHIGDTHLQAAHPRHADRLAALDQILEHARTLAEADQLAAIVWPGDLFHVKSTIEDRNALAPRVQAFAALAPVVVVAGNHDAPGDLDILPRLQALYAIRVVTTPQVLHFDTPTDIQMACFAVPYPFKAAMVATGIEHQGLGQTAHDLFDAIFMAAAAELQAAADAGELPLMIGHLAVGGAVSSTGQPQIGGELEISTAMLARLGPMYQGLSHIHKHQAIGSAVYAGSVARLDFGEREPKGFIEIEYQRDGRTWEHRWRFVPLTVPAMHLVEGRLTRDAFTIEAVDGEHVSRGPGDPGLVLPGGDFESADVKCRYRFVKAEIGALDHAKVHAEFAGCRTLVLDPIAELEHSVRAPEIAAAVTLEAKVEAYLQRQAIPRSIGLLRKVHALQQQPPDAILRMVAIECAAAEVPRNDDDDGPEQTPVEDYDRAMRATGLRA